MGEHTISTTSSAMQMLLELLNSDLRSGRALPAFVKNETERAEARRLQALMVDYLTPVLGLDPHELGARRRITIEALLRQAERRGRSREARELRRQLDRARHGRLATTQRARIDGLLTLALWLTEWAQGAPLSPFWQVDALSRAERSQIPADRQYRIGANVFAVTQHLGAHHSLTTAGMLALGACLERGELNRLRVCAERDCPRYFYAEDLRQRFCGRACSRRHDNERVAARMQRSREKRDAGAKALFLATLPSLRVSQFRALEPMDEDTNKDKKKARALFDNLVGQFPSLNTGELDRLRDLVKKHAQGISLDQLWWKNRTRPLFRKLQTARAV